jgi:hypothetical protein
MFLFDPDDDNPLATDVPCIAELSVGGGVEHRWYGPFANLIEARNWCSKQFPKNFRILPLRRTDKERERNEDWYYPDHLHDDMSNLIDDFVLIDTYRKWEASHD